MGSTVWKQRERLRRHTIMESIVSRLRESRKRRKRMITESTALRRREPLRKIETRRRHMATESTVLVLREKRELDQKHPSLIRNWRVKVGNGWMIGVISFQETLTVVGKNTTFCSVSLK
jgi:hypothetical protein